MTTPVDPRPYAGPTDLVTAEDVAEWLRERAERALLGNCHPPTHVLHYALVDLRARLDRERRQACERGWQAHAAASRQRGRQARKARGKGWAEWAAQRESERAHHMRLALAFRAAARAK